ncbi:hypothetical protein [Lacrimispora sp.]|uniref:hypothetical protein n=1 Tax=Lacrimispora sp. TaxID=2719234 RepID=UPI002FD9083F
MNWMIKNFAFLNFAEHDNCLWVSALGYNGLFCIPLDTMKPRFIGEFPGEDLNARNIHRSAVISGEKVIFAPFFGNRIGEYDIETGEFTEHTGIGKDMSKAKFETSVCVNDTIYFIPQYYPDILSYDCRRKKVAEIKGWKELLTKEEAMQEGIAFGLTADIYNDKLYLPSRKTNGIMLLDINTGHMTIRRIGPSHMRYLTAKIVGKQCWILPACQEEQINVWDLETNEIATISEFPKGFSSESIPFISINNCGRNMLAFSHMANMSVLIDKCNFTVREYKELSQVDIKKEKNGWGGNYYFAKELGNHHLLSVSKYDNAVLVIDVETLEVTRQILKSEIAEIMLVKRMFEQEHRGMNKVVPILREGEEVDLLDFLAVVKNDSILKNNIYTHLAEKNYGSEIHNNSKQWLKGEKNEGCKTNFE